MKLSSAGLTDVGMVRAANQDAFYIDPDERFFIVADGMGGHACGDRASQLAIEAIQSYLTDYWESPLDSETLLKQALTAANESIVRDQQIDPTRADMGTTAVALIYRDGQFWSAHVGDSRLYLFHDNSLEQITEDHTLIARAVKLGKFTPEEARDHHMRHVLYQCLGREEVDRIDINAIEVAGGDRLLMCSDGLTEEVTDEDIAAQLKSLPDAKAIAAELVNEAKANGGSDNVTVVAIVAEGAAM